MKENVHMSIGAFLEKFIIALRKMLIETVLRKLKAIFRIFISLSYWRYHRVSSREKVISPCSESALERVE